MDPEEQARLAAQRAMSIDLGGAPGPQYTDTTVSTPRPADAGTPIQGEGRWSPPGPQTAVPAATVPLAAEAPAEAPPAVNWEPNTSRPSGTGRPANPYLAALAEYSRRRPGQVPAQGDPELTQIMADMGQRVQGAREAGNAAVNEQAGANNAQTLLEEQNRNDELQRRQQAIEERVNEVSNMRVDPNNWFASRGTVGAFGAAIAVGLGAAAQSLQGGNGPNNALNIINAAIDRDMTAQQQNIQNANAGVRNQVTALEQLRQTYGSDRAAREAFRMRSLQIAERQAEQAVQRAQTPEAREIAARVLQEVAGAREMEGVKLQNSLTLQENAAALTMQRAALDFQARRSGGGGTRRQPYSQPQVQNAQQINAVLRLAQPGRSEAYYQAGTRDILQNGVNAGPENFVPTLTRFQQQQEAAQAAAAGGGVTPAQEAAANTARQSRVNAVMSQSDQPGFGPVETIGRTFGAHADASLPERAVGAGLRWAGRAAGFNFEVDPAVLGRINQLVARRRELYGAAQTRNEAAPALDILPDLSGSINETDLGERMAAFEAGLRAQEEIERNSRPTLTAAQRARGATTRRTGPFIPGSEE